MYRAYGELCFGPQHACVPVGRLLNAGAQSCSVFVPVSPMAIDIESNNFAQCGNSLGMHFALCDQSYSLITILDTSLTGIFRRYDVSLMEVVMVC